MNRTGIVACVLAAGFATSAQAQFLTVIDSTNDRVLLLDAFDGSIINDNFIDLSTNDPGTPKALTQVGNELWIADQLRDRIDRYNAQGQLVGSIGGGDDSPINNVRGIELVGNTLYISQGSSSSIADRAIVTYDITTGDFTGSFGRPTDDFSPFDVLHVNGELLVSNIDTGNDGIERYGLDGEFLGFFAQSDGSSSFDFLQQLAVRDNGNILAAGFSPPSGVFEFTADGTELGAVAGVDLGIRGVAELGNGSIIYTNGAGLWIDDVLVLEDFSGQYIEATSIPAAPTGGLLALGGLLAARRRR
jgi:hypothetical protein